MNKGRIKDNVNSELKYTNISNMLLLPGNYNLKQHESLVQVIVNQHPIFRELCLLEKEIEPLIKSMEEKGLLVSSEWLTKGLVNKKMPQKNIG